MKSVAIFEMLSSCKLVQWRQLEEKLRSASDPPRTTCIVSAEPYFQSVQRYHNIPNVLTCGKLSPRLQPGPSGLWEDRLKVAMEEHKEAVVKISSRLLTFYQHKEPFRIFHGSTNSTKNEVRDASKSVDTSSLNHVLNVNPEAKTCLVEPNVPMDQLIDRTMKHGLVPPVVMVGYPL